MNDFVKKATSFLFFDLPLHPELISASFNKAHKKLLVENPDWSTSATKQKLTYQYWSVHVLRHFLALFSLPALLFIFLQLNQTSFRQSFLIVIIVGVICYFILYVFHYRAEYFTTYLPILETVKESYDRKQLELVEKCRQAQLSNFSLALFFYVLSNINGFGQISIDDRSANLLMRLYGVDPGSMKKHLALIIRISKKTKLTDRKITEFKNRFAETYDFMESLHFVEGIKRLKELEIRFFAP